MEHGIILRSGGVAGGGGSVCGGGSDGSRADTRPAGSPAPRRGSAGLRIRGAGAYAVRWDGRGSHSWPFSLWNTFAPGHPDPIVGDGGRDDGHYIPGGLVSHACFLQETLATDWYAFRTRLSLSAQRNSRTVRRRPRSPSRRRNSAFSVRRVSAAARPSTSPQRTSRPSCS